MGSEVHILILEDDPVQRKGYASALPLVFADDLISVHITLTSGYEEARNELVSRPFSVAMLDLDDVGGLELVREHAATPERFFNTPLVVCSGTTEQDTIQQVKDFRVPFIPKPVIVSELKDTLLRVSAKRFPDLKGTEEKERDQRVPGRADRSR